MTMRKPLETPDCPICAADMVYRWQNKVMEVRSDVGEMDASDWLQMQRDLTAVWFWFHENFDQVN